MFHFRFPLCPCFYLWTLLCQFWGPSSGPDGCRGLVPRGELSPHQHPVDENGCSGSGSFSASVVRSECHSDERQRHGCHLSAESGQHGLLCIVPHGIRYCSLYQASFCLPVSSVYPREGECSDGMIPLTKGVQGNLRSLRASPSRCVHYSGKCQASSLHLSSSGSNGLEAGCFSAPLGPSLSLHFPLFALLRQVLSRVRLLTGLSLVLVVLL